MRIEKRSTAVPIAQNHLHNHANCWYIGEFTLRRNHLDVPNVWSHLFKPATYRFTWEYTLRQEKNLYPVKLAINTLLMRVSYRDIWKLIAKFHTVVRCAKESFKPLSTWSDIWEITPEKNLMAVLNVLCHFLNLVTCAYILKLIRDF
jgi:hypothetical protein